MLRLECSPAQVGSKGATGPFLHVQRSCRWCRVEWRWCIVVEWTRTWLVRLALFRSLYGRHVCGGPRFGSSSLFYSTVRCARRVALFLGGKREGAPGAPRPAVPSRLHCGRGAHRGRLMWQLTWRARALTRPSKDYGCARSLENSLLLPLARSSSPERGRWLGGVRESDLACVSVT